jgi:AcrR family transcriptional regulator
MPLRADAEENRRAILDAAAALFAQRGLGVPLDDIARRASVGNATLYRRFPDRCSLVGAVFEERMQGYVAASRAGVEANDPWQGFVELLTHLCAAQSADLGLAELLTTTLIDAGPEIARLRREMLVNLRSLIARLHDAELVPVDFADQDVVLILIANAGIVRTTHAEAPDAWRRHLAFVLRGLSESRSVELPSPPSTAEIEAAMRAGLPPGPPPR